MKRVSIINTLFEIKILLLCCFLFSSCEKNNIDESGSANLKVVNAAPNSTAQSFTLAGTSLIDGGLAFTDASDYISTYAGSRLVAQFFNEGTTKVYGSGEIWLFKDLSFTAYLAGDGNTARVKLYQDKLSAPASGKVKVKFIHLSDDAPSNINIKYADGDNLITNLTRDIESSYLSINPGDLSIKVYNTALKTHVADFTIPGLVAGKIYTIYFAGTSSSGTSANLVVYN